MIIITLITADLLHAKIPQGQEEAREGGGGFTQCPTGATSECSLIDYILKSKGSTRS